MIKLRHFASASGLALAIVLSLSPLTPARAQSVVFDPSNYAQNVMTAAHTLQQINNQISSLQNQVLRLIEQRARLVLQRGDLIVDLLQRMRRRHDVLGVITRIEHHQLRPRRRQRG